MLTPRHLHSLYYFNNYIYAIGGYQCRSAERFNLKSLKWENLNDLNEEERQRPILYSYGNYLYAFFGYKIGSYLDTIERLNVRTSKGKWELLPFIKNIDDLAMIGAGIISKSKDEIILLGGRNGKGDKTTALSFNLKTNTFSKVDDLELEDPTFYGESLLMKFGQSVYGHFNNSNNTILKIEFSS